MTKPIIAVFGTNGALGVPTIDALTSSTFSSKVSLPIRAITRDPTKYEDSDLIKYYKADISDVDSFKDALTGVDVLINVGPTNQYIDNSLDAAIKFTKLKLYIPSQFGTELDAVDLPNFLDIKTNHSKKARAAGIKTIDVITSLFAQPGSFLYETIGAVGYDAETKTATIRGDPKTEFDISYLVDIGKVNAAIATKDDYSSLPDKIRVSSDRVTEEQVIENYEKTHEVKIERKYVSKEDTYKKAHELYEAGFKFQDFLFYVQYLISEGNDKGVAFSKKENELVNPGESLFKWTKWGSI